VDRDYPLVAQPKLARLTTTIVLGLQQALYDAKEVECETQLVVIDNQKSSLSLPQYKSEREQK